MKSCTQCGKCCIKYSHGGLSATSEEIEYWRQFRPEIARYVSGSEIWFDPASDRQLEICPWLRESPEGGNYSCDIYHDRPDDCRVYPTSVDQMILDDCEMIETKDLKDPQKAQQRLAVIMSDSWPS